MKKKLGLKEGLTTGLVISIFLVLGVLIYNGIDSESLFDDGSKKGPTIIYEDEVTNFVSKKFLSDGYSVSTSNDDVLNIGDGTIEAKQSGSYTIVVTDENGNEVHQEDILVCKKLTTDSFQTNSINLEKGEAIEINLDLGENNNCYKGISYSSDNTSIAKIKNKNNVYGVAKGQTFIIVVQNDEKVTIPVNVFEKEDIVSVKGITLTPDKVKMEVNKEVTINAVVSPSNATDKSIIWKSSNSNVVSVNNKGQIFGKKAGTSEITAITSNGKKATTTVTVINPDKEEYVIAYDKNTSLAVAGTMENKSYEVETSAQLSQNNYTLDGWTFIGWWASKNGKYFGCKSGEQYYKNCGGWESSKNLSTIGVYANKETLDFSSKLRAQDKVTMKALWGKITSAKVTEVKNNEAKIKVNFYLPIKTTWMIRVYNGKMNEYESVYTNTSNKVEKEISIANATNGKILVNACLVQEGKITNVCIKNVTLNTGLQIKYYYPGSSSDKYVMDSHYIAYNEKLKDYDGKHLSSDRTFLGWIATHSDSNKNVTVIGCKTTPAKNNCSSKYDYSTKNYGWHKDNQIDGYVLYQNKSEVGNIKPYGERVQMQLMNGKIKASATQSGDSYKVKVELNTNFKGYWEIKYHGGSGNWLTSTETKNNKLHTTDYTKWHSSYINNIKVNNSDIDLSIKACIAGTNVCTKTEVIKLKKTTYATIKFDSGEYGTIKIDNMTLTSSDRVQLNKIQSISSNEWFFSGWVAEKEVNGQVKRLGCTTDVKMCSSYNVNMDWYDASQVQTSVIFADGSYTEKISSGDKITMKAVWIKPVNQYNPQIGGIYTGYSMCVSDPKTRWNIYKGETALNAPFDSGKKPVSNKEGCEYAIWNSHENLNSANLQFCLTHNISSQSQELHYNTFTEIRGSYLSEYVNASGCLRVEIKNKDIINGVQKENSYSGNDKH